MSKLDPDAFRGKPDEYLAWAAENHRSNTMWCARHWMPCPVDGKPGVVASVILQVEALGDVPADVARPGVDWTTAVNSWFANQTVPVCCKLGDEKMAWLWWVITLPEGLLCYEPYPHKGVSVRRCWRPAGHVGDHEWQKLLDKVDSSIFDLMGELQPGAGPWPGIEGCINGW
jgi:hypothetical protein